MKIKLISDGGFKGMDSVDMSTVFDAEMVEDIGVDILAEDLIKAGAIVTAGDNQAETHSDGRLTFFFDNGVGCTSNKEYEVVE